MANEHVLHQVTSVETVNRTITSVTTTTQSTTITTTATATPGRVVELNAYEESFCGVVPVPSNGNAPNFQEIQLTYDQSRRYTNCARINQDSLSFSWDIVSFGSIPDGCNLYFYRGDSCFNDNGGSVQLSLINGEGSCRNLRGIRSVRMFC